MKSDLKYMCIFILALFAGTAVMSGFLALMFRDTNTGSKWEYLTGYLWHRFMEFYMIFVPMVLVGSALLLVGWLLYRLMRTQKSR
ncbi:MAG TPA: hypothetical protein VJ694_00270 [Patescibacteria group bacterium]|nr:hypothetical protein [Patescibacteria group bacterium]